MPPKTQCGKPPRKMTVIVTDGAGHNIGDGEVTIKAPWRRRGYPEPGAPLRDDRRAKA